MKITVINGNMRHGSTWHCMDTIRRELDKYEKTEVTEYFLPKEMPHFCAGCFSCIYNGEHTCPHASCVRPIVEAMTQADLIVLTSPVYGMDVSGQMKALLDHLCYMWMSHRPNPKMFDKIGLIVSTTAGAGLGHTAKTMKNSLKYWGVKRVYSFATPVAAMKWDDVTGKKRTNIQKSAARTAAKILRSVKNMRKLPNPAFRSFFFRLMAGMQKKNTWNKTDREYWERQGWLTGGKPF